MASEEHLKILKQGVKTWNLWRKEHPNIRPDLRRANLTTADLHKVNLSRVILTEANLRGANLAMADLRGANLYGATLHEANLHQVNLIRATLHEANLTRATLTEADLTGTGLTEASLSGANLRRANLVGADLTKADLTKADLTGANLTGANLTQANLIRATLREADLNEADFHNANLGWANLTGANLHRANLFLADLREAFLFGSDLTEAKLIEANLSRADFNEADFHGAEVGWTIFGSVDLSTVKGLDTMSHSGPSTIGIDSLSHSKGNIPEAFLRGAGIPDTFITYIVSFTGKVIQYYSCFISYSSKDEAFAQHLHADLQQRGVRCWFAPEDMKIGDKIRPRIDETIRIHDKQLLILSEHSINSTWVEQEVETAFEEERKRNQVVLFPIRLDKTVKETDQTWAADIRRTRHIGDFSRWQDHNAYQQAFEHLLRDLKAKE